MNHSEAQRLAQTLIREHCPEVPFAWDNARRRMGCAHFTRMTLGGVRMPAVAKKITLSRALVGAATEAEVLDCIIHEIGHVKAGHEAGHGPLWRREVRAMGGSARTTHNVDTGVAPYMHKCRCGAVHKRFKRTKNHDHLICTKCRAKIVWMSGAQFQRLGLVEA